MGRKNMKRARGFDAILKWLAWGMFLGSLAAAISACGWLGGKAPAQYAEELMEDDIELESRGDDAMALVEEVSDLFQCGETGWRLGRLSEDTGIEERRQMVCGGSVSAGYGA